MLTLSTAIIAEKNKVATKSAWIILIDITLSDLFLSGTEPMYTLNTGSISFPLVLGPSEEYEFEVIYTPTGGSALDFITLYTECLMFILPVAGGSGIAKIEVTDIDFGQILVGTKTAANSSGSQVYLQITNNGAKDLLITGYHFDPVQSSTDGPFFYTPQPELDMPTIDNPWIIKKNGGVRTVRKFEFLPLAREKYETRIYFESNAADITLDPNRKDYGIIRGEGIQPGPQLTSYNWGEKRVKTINKSTVRLTNTGNTSLTIMRIENSLDNWITNQNGHLVSPDGSYKVLNVASYDGKIVYPSDGTDEPKYIDIDVEFEPQSEYIPHGSSPTSTRFYVNFEKGSGVPDNSIYSVLEGRGILPKISVSGYKFPITKERELCSEEGTFIVRNTSSTSRLYIKSISFANGSYQVNDFTLTPLINSNDGVYIDKNDSLVYKVTFRPENTSPPIRIARILIDNDAEFGPDPNPIKTNDTLLEGESYDEGIEVSDIDYGTVTRCIDTISQFVIINESTTNTLQIDSIIVDRSNIYTGAFELLDTTYPISILPESNRSIRVRFVASRTNHIGDISTVADVYSNLGRDSAIITARPLIIPVHLQMDTVENRLAGDLVNMPIRISMSTTDPFYLYSNALIDTVFIEFKFIPQTLYLQNIVGNNGWQFNITDANYELGIIRLLGFGNPLLSDGKLCDLNFLVLSSSSTSLPIDFTSISFDVRDNCISSTNSPGRITYNICAEDLRTINIGLEDYALIPVVPNPYKGDNLTLHYSLGLDADVFINIYNSSGELVCSVINGPGKVGKYSKEINISDLSSGSYIITMRSGPFETKQQLVIIK